MLTYGKMCKQFDLRNCKIPFQSIWEIVNISVYTLTIKISKKHWLELKY